MTGEGRNERKMGKREAEEEMETVEDEKQEVDGEEKTKDQKSLEVEEGEGGRYR